jgi:hypothetical protein
MQLIGDCTCETLILKIYRTVVKSGMLNLLQQAATAKLQNGESFLLKVTGH